MKNVNSLVVNVYVCIIVYIYCIYMRYIFNQENEQYHTLL